MMKIKKWLRLNLLNLTDWLSFRWVDLRWKMEYNAVLKLKPELWYHITVGPPELFFYEAGLVQLRVSREGKPNRGFPFFFKNKLVIKAGDRSGGKTKEFKELPGFDAEKSLEDFGPVTWWDKWRWDCKDWLVFSFWLEPDAILKGKNWRVDIIAVLVLLNILLYLLKN